MHPTQSKELCTCLLRKSNFDLEHFAGVQLDDWGLFWLVFGWGQFIFIFQLQKRSREVLNRKPIFQKILKQVLLFKSINHDNTHRLLCSYKSKFKYFIRIVFTSHKLKLGLMFFQDCHFSLSQVKVFSPAMVTLITDIPEPALNQPSWGNKAQLSHSGDTALIFLIFKSTQIYIFQFFLIKRMYNSSRAYPLTLETFIAKLTIQHFNLSIVIDRLCN